MKTDSELKIIISDQRASYNQSKDILTFSVASVTRYRKNGYKIYDENGSNLGIVYMADDERAKRFGNAEIVFFKQHQKQYGTWRIIKIHGQYLPFNHLENELSKRREYVVTTDARQRKS